MPRPWPWQSFPAKPWIECIPGITIIDTDTDTDIRTDHCGYDSCMRSVPYIRILLLLLPTTVRCQAFAMGPENLLTRLPSIRAPYPIPTPHRLFPSRVIFTLRTEQQSLAFALRPSDGPDRGLSAVGPADQRVTQLGSIPGTITRGAVRVSTLESIAPTTNDKSHHGDLGWIYVGLRTSEPDSANVPFSFLALVVLSGLKIQLVAVVELLVLLRCFDPLICQCPDPRLSGRRWR
jgi:hypothetical protein